MCEGRVAREPTVVDQYTGAIAEDQYTEDCLIYYL